jgi:Uma2 family endonuclease
MTALPQKMLFNVDEYYRMADAGILTEDHRVELIQGEIVRMPPIGSRHAAVVNRVSQILMVPLVGKAVVTVQNPVRLDDHSEPEPDVAVLRLRDDFYAETHPHPEDVILLVEVSDTSYEFDTKVKLPLYAENGIPEVWIVHVPNDEVWVFREPSGRRYRHKWRFRRGQMLAPGGFPELELDAARVLG